MTFGPSQRIELSPWDGPNRYDHAPERRDPDSLAELWHHPQAKVIDLDREGRFAADRMAEATDGPLHAETAFLGIADGVPWFARRVQQFEAGATIRDTELSELEQQLVMAGMAVLNWIDRCRYCARCGGLVTRTNGGFAATCFDCQAEHFPRTDPAVIVAVLDPDDRIFLAHQGSWPPGRASILAGFVEAGESAENALVRELAEEAELQIEAYRFLGSQPWPFPRSLMLGYVARSKSPGRVDQDELEWGGWYSRADVDAAEADGSLILPGHGSIARRIVDAWRRGVLPAPEEPGSAVG